MISGEPDPLLSDCSDLLKNTILKCLNKDPSKRPTIKEMLSLCRDRKGTELSLEPQPLYDYKDYISERVRVFEESDSFPTGKEVLIDKKMR